MADLPPMGTTRMGTTPPGTTPPGATPTDVTPMGAPPTGSAATGASPAGSAAAGAATAGVSLRRAAAADLATILAVEATPGHDAFINPQPRAAHEAQFADPAFAYFVAEEDGAPIGFAILSEMTEAHGNRCLKRLAIAEPGRGRGRAVLRAATALAFAPIPSRAPAHRFWLHTLAGNARALHLYRSEGMTEEGRLRQARPRPDGTRADLVILSILRPEWEARQAG